MTRNILLHCASLLLAGMLFLTAVPLMSAPLPELMKATPYALLPARAEVPVAPPREFRAIYPSYWSAAAISRAEGILQLACEGLINDVLADVKDVTGTVAVDTRVPKA